MAAGFSNSIYGSVGATGRRPVVMPQPQQAHALSGLSETLFGYGTPVARATTHNDAVRNVYIRLNTNQWKKDGEPLTKKEYYSGKLIGGIIWKYRALVFDRKLDYYSPENASDNYLDMVRSKCCSVEPSRAVTKLVLDGLYYATYGSNPTIDPNFTDPVLDGQPSERARQQVAHNNEVAEAKKEAADQECGFFCTLASPFKALGNLSQAMSIVIPAMVVATGGAIIYTFVSKAKQFDVNNAYNQNHRTIREVGPDAAAAIVRKGA